MEQHELLRYVAETLDRLGFSYFVTGSFAGVLYGEYRMTNDIDIVVQLREEQLDRFLSGFPPDTFYVDRDAALDAIQTRFQFNLIHRDSLAKVDFIITPGSSHDREVLKRVRRMSAGGEYPIAYSSPEDLLLKKLIFHKESGSDKHLRDAVGIMKKSRSDLDRGYIDQWADWLDVLKLWREVEKRAKGT